MNNKYFSTIQAMGWHFEVPRAV